MALLSGLPLVNDSSTETISIDIDVGDKRQCDTASDAGRKYHRDPSAYDHPVPVIKAYRNSDFLNSSHARHLRILAEYEETMQRLRANGVRATIQFFGSARAKDREQYEAAMATALSALSSAQPASQGYADAEERITRLKQIEWMVPFMSDIQELAQRITEWSHDRVRRSRQLVTGVDRTKAAVRRTLSSEKIIAVDTESTSATSTPVDAKPTDAKPTDAKPVVVKPTFTASPTAERRYAYLPHSSDDNHPEMLGETAADLFVCTGGGPGFMEAANRGASLVPGGRSIGMGISLPFETGLNPYVTPELAFEYHYFFTRKFGMAYYMQALVAAPGGFGTMDELFELMTLKQTGKMNRELPIVLFGKRYWQTVVNWQALAEFGTISQKEVDDLCFTDSIEEAFTFITNRLEGAHI